MSLVVFSGLGYLGTPRSPHFVCTVQRWRLQYEKRDYSKSRVDYSDSCKNEMPTQGGDEQCAADAFSELA